jgi:hypothetical protein
MNDQTSTEVKNMNEKTNTQDQTQQDPIKLLRLNKAGILDEARLRPHSATSTPTLQSPNIEQEIIKTIVKCTQQDCHKEPLDQSDTP